MVGNREIKSDININKSLAKETLKHLSHFTPYTLPQKRWEFEWCREERKERTGDPLWACGMLVKM